jgi:hypothetical protein
MKPTLSTLLATTLLIGVTLGVTAPVFAQNTPSPSVTGRGVQATLLVRAREFAANMFDNQFLNRLNALRARVSANTKLSAEQKQVLLAKIDGEIIWFTNKKGELATATTVAQIRTIIRDARNRFLQLAQSLRHLYLARGYVTSLERVIENIEKNIIPKVEAKLTELQGKGVNVTTELGYLMNAKTALANAKNEITQVKNSTTFENAKKHFDLAKAQIKTARQELKTILDSLKGRV